MRTPGVQGSADGAGKMYPVRTCVGCRQRCHQSELLRVIAKDGVAILDERHRHSGRGAWVHANKQCVANAVARRAFARALRVPVSLDTLPLENRLNTIMDQS